MLRKLLPLILSILLLLYSVPALAADYSISQYSMDISVRKDGSADVTETLLYEFDGEYNGILSLFDTDGTGMPEDFRMTIDGELLSPVSEMKYEQNTYTFIPDGNLIEVRSYSPGSDDTRLVTYEYRMPALALRYEDTGMILRSFIGENNSVSLQNAVVRVSFEEEGDFLAFVHGGMSEEDVTIGETFVQFGPKTVSSGSSVEMRILFPAALIADAPLHEGMMLDAALDEEARIAEEAEQRSRLIEKAKYIFSIAYSLFFFLAWLVMVRLYGLKHSGRNDAEPARLTAWPAAFASAALNDEPDTDALSGTLVELMQMGRVSMTTEEDDLRFTLTDNAPDGLWPHQLSLIKWLFRDSNFFLLSTLNAGSDYERAQAFEQGYTACCAQVTQDMRDHHLKYRNDGLRITTNSLIVLLGTLGAGFIMLAGETNILLGCAIAGLLFFLLYLMSRIRTLTDEGERLRRDAEALVNAPAGSKQPLSLLPFCTALGMTEPLIETVPSQSSAEAPSFLAPGWQQRLHLLGSSLRESHFHNASIPDPSDSSSASSSASSSGSNGSSGGHGAW